MKNKPEEKERLDVFKRNNDLESLLQLINKSLFLAENKLLESPEKLGADYPIIFIMGPLRSGTTLFTQWLANTGIIAYPTNLLSRFYGAPVIGAQIQLLLTDPRYNFRNEILDFNSAISFESENGKTKGALAPNEFWYFWRRFLNFKELDWLPDEELFKTVDHEMLVNELTGLTRVFNKPFALKSMILNYNIPFLDKLFPKALFVQIKRDPLTNVASVLDARKRQLGSESEWYSFKIPEYHQLKDLDPILQSAGQVHFINKAVTAGINSLSESRKLEVQYEDFCKNPKLIFDQLIEKLGINDAEYVGPTQFNSTRNAEIPNQLEIETAIATCKSL